MFGRRIRCEANGVHRVRTARLEVVSGRLSDWVRYMVVCAEPEIQYWMGWDPAEVDDVRAQARAKQIRPYATPLHRPTPTIPANLEKTEFVAIHRETMLIVGGVGLHTEPDGRPAVGGAVRGGLRSQGYGHEIMAAVLEVLHRHFGLPELRAACEVSNVASRRWLAGAGFELLDEQAKHTLPDGRVIDSLWWVHRDPEAERRCPYLYATADEASRAAVTAGNLPPDLAAAGDGPTR
jgi:RimJ/RimL family protein N-acetyltransferase